MRAFGIPLWALVLVLCIVAPFLVRAWVDAEQRRAKKRTAEVLQGIARPRNKHAAESVRQASTHSTPLGEEEPLTSRESQ